MQTGRMLTTCGSSSGGSRATTTTTKVIGGRCCSGEVKTGQLKLDEKTDSRANPSKMPAHVER